MFDISIQFNAAVNWTLQIISTVTGFQDTFMFNPLWLFKNLRSIKTFDLIPVPLLWEFGQPSLLVLCSLSGWCHTDFYVRDDIEEPLKLQSNAPRPSEGAHRFDASLCFCLSCSVWDRPSVSGERQLAGGLLLRPASEERSQGHRTGRSSHSRTRGRIRLGRWPWHTRQNWNTSLSLMQRDMDRPRPDWDCGGEEDWEGSIFGFIDGNAVIASDFCSFEF